VYLADESNSRSLTEPTRAGLLTDSTEEDESGNVRRQGRERDGMT
jgi:hypothetical protein